MSHVNLSPAATNALGQYAKLANTLHRVTGGNFDPVDQADYAAIVEHATKVATTTTRTCITEGRKRLKELDVDEPQPDAKLRRREIEQAVTRAKRKTKTTRKSKKR